MTTPDTREPGGTSPTGAIDLPDSATVYDKLRSIADHATGAATRDFLLGLVDQLHDVELICQLTLDGTSDSTANQAVRRVAFDVIYELRLPSRQRYIDRLPADFTQVDGDGV